VLNRLKNRFLFFDGAMGTMLQKSGLKVGALPEEFNIKNREVIVDIHRKYLDAGSDIIITNTFGANRLKLKGSYTVDEIVTAAVNCGKEAIGQLKNKYVALDIGPIGTLLSPLGTLSFDYAYDIFKEQIIAGTNAGADLILIETMADIYEVKAAILAAKENSHLPVFCTMTFQDNNRTFAGTDVTTFVSVVEGLGVDVLGVNCSLGPKELQSIVDDLLKYSSIPVMVQANAGLPKYHNDETYYDISPDDYSDEIKIMADKGVAIFGGCCGTTPEYIENLIDAIKDKKPKEIVRKHLTTTTSASMTVFLGDEVKIIGERINPTGKKKIKEALKENNLDYILKEAINQQETGSHILDINVGLPDIDEKEMMSKVIQEVQSIIALPLQIDSSNVDVIEAAARIYNGKPIINSVNGKKDNMEAILPIVKKYGALVIALTLDEDGIPKTSQKRVEIATKIIETAKEYGIPEENILVDPLVLTASAEQSAVMETLKAIPLIKAKHKNVKIVLGASNVSFGLPNRKLLNSTYLAMALGFGLDAPITDSTNESLMDVIRSFKVLANQDIDSKDYIEKYSNIVVEKQISTSELDLKEIIIKGLKDEALKIALQLLESTSSLDIVNNYMIPALDIVGERYEKQEIFLPQLIRSAETSKVVFEAMKEKISGTTEEVSGHKIVLATVQGDIHDIGKNIVKLILENYGYEIIDLGKDVAIEKVVETVQKEDVHLVGLSALMTTTVKNMEYTIEALKKVKPDVKIMVGGAVLTPDYAKTIGSDYYSKDAREAVDIAREVFG